MTLYGGNQISFNVAKASCLDRNKDIFVSCRQFIRSTVFITMKHEVSRRDGHKYRSIERMDG